MYWNEKVGSHWGWMLPKVPIISKNTSNKIRLELLNFQQETQWTHISDSPRNGARGCKHLLFLKYKALEWECRSLEHLAPLLGVVEIYVHCFFFCRKLNFRLLLSKVFFDIIGILSRVQPSSEPTSTFQKSIECGAIIYGVASWLHHSVV